MCQWSSRGAGRPAAWAPAARPSAPSAVRLPIVTPRAARSRYVQPHVVSSRRGAGSSAATSPLAWSTTARTGCPAANNSSATATSGRLGTGASARARAAAVLTIA